MTYDPTTVTLDELLEMENRLRDYTKRLRNKQGQRHGYWRLFSLTAAHGCPSTHEEAVHTAETLAWHLLGDQTLVVEGAPRLHYAEAEDGSRGVSNRFSSASKFGLFDPGNFGNRTDLGPAWTLACASHHDDYESCNRYCRVGVQFDGRFLIDIVRMQGEVTVPIVGG